jgi:enamine deaminase RidA (YjgF/YER057c/UK114 family)
LVTASSRHTGEGRCPFLPWVPAFAGNAKYWNAKMRQLISSGSKFEAEAGYSRAVVDAEWVFVAGTTGFDYARMTIVDDPAEQARQAFRNIEKALAEAGAALADVVRVRYYVPDIGDWPAIVPVLGEVFGQIRPAAPACRETGQMAAGHPSRGSSRRLACNSWAGGTAGFGLAARGIPLSRLA